MKCKKKKIIKTVSKYLIQACSENASHKILTDICELDTPQIGNLMN